MTKETSDPKVPRGSRAEGSTIDARSTQRTNTAAWQSIRSVEETAGERLLLQINEQDIRIWKRRLDEMSGSYSGTLESGLRSKLAARFREKPFRNDQQMVHDLGRMRQFIAETSEQILMNPQVGIKTRQVFEAFARRLANLEVAYQLIQEMTSEGESLSKPSNLDEGTRAFLDETYARLEKSIRGKLERQKFWISYERVNKKSVDLEEWLVARYLKDLEKDFSEAAAILLSHKYYLQRALRSPLDEVSINAFTSYLRTVEQLARYVEKQRARFEQLGIRLDLLADLPDTEQKEAQQSWNELLSGNSNEEGLPLN